MLSNLQNYGPFASLVETGHYDLITDEITKENYDSYVNGLTNIFSDGIETEEVQNFKFKIIFSDGIEIPAYINDVWFNLIFWTIPVFAEMPITVKWYFCTIDGITKKKIQRYFDELSSYRSKLSFIAANNLYDEILMKFRIIERFAMYLSNTVNFHDTYDLMMKYPEFDQTIHADLSDVPIEDVKNVGMDYTLQQIKYIKNSDHCLVDSLTAEEAVNKKQYKEVACNIGTKPDGRGGIFPHIINNSFINGGVSMPESYIIDSSCGRTAQILQKMNVGTSGAFARLLETNNLDTFFNDDPTYDCDTKNFIKVFIKDTSWLTMYNNRYYRTTPDGPDKKLNMNLDTHLIGQTLYFRSPITCNSYAHGRGICRKCYGDLYYVNRDINPGKIAAELLSSVYTQMLLSAKHLLESSVIEQKWNPEFDDLFEINLNTISINEDIDTTGYKMMLDSNLFNSSDDEDDDDLTYDESVPMFDVKYPDGSIVHFHTANDDNIYFTEDLNRLLKSKKAKEDDNGVYTISLDTLKTIPYVFTVKIQNKELQRTLERSKHIINREQDTSSYTKDEIVREFIMANAEGGIHVNAIHLETIIANQMRDPDNILEMPDWGIPDAPYKILTLNSALDNSPSITVTLEYQKIGKTLASPLSTKKTKPSIFDPFFMEHPQDFVVNKDMISDDYEMEEGGVQDNITEAISFNQSADDEEDDMPDFF